MRILMTQRELIGHAGSELFTIEVAAELAKRGHQVSVYCTNFGMLADIMHSAGVWTKKRLADIPWVPDIIHGQHHLQAIAALSFFLKVPAIYICHGVFPWVEQVPIHPRIRTYMLMSPWMVRLVETKFGIPGERLQVLHNFVNTERFSQVRDPPSRPRRAVLFGNRGLPRQELLRLERACARHGLSLAKIGHAYKNQHPRPEILLPHYDVAFAIGKCALEAMACGCAVIPIIPGQAGDLITMENFKDWSYSNFSPRYYASAEQIGTKWLDRELQRYSPATVLQVTEKVRAEHDLGTVVNQLERSYAAAIEDYAAAKPADDTAEFAPYLEKLSSEVDAMWVELERHRPAMQDVLSGRKKQTPWLRTLLRWTKGKCQG